jgi:hypothetical protein
MDKCISAFTPSQDMHKGLVPFVNASEMPDGRIKLMVRTAITGEFGVIEMNREEWLHWPTECVGETAKWVKDKTDKAKK